MIDHVGTVFVPTSDQERALAFFVGKLGFVKRMDARYGGGRWLEVAPPGGAIALALVPRGEGRGGGRDEVLCAFSTRDISAEHARLRGLEVDVDAVIGRVGTQRPGLVAPEVSVTDPQPPQVMLRDPDGNRFLLVEASFEGSESLDVP